jgi:hypothetical protein
MVKDEITLRTQSMMIRASSEIMDSFVEVESDLFSVTNKDMMIIPEETQSSYFSEPSFADQSIKSMTVTRRDSRTDSINSDTTPEEAIDLQSSRTESIVNAGYP